MTLNIDILSLEGTKTGSIQLPESVFGCEVRKDLLARAIQWQQAEKRAGLAHTKTRGEINRTHAKWFRQKGTGRARHGARTPSLFVGGGVVFGPRGRDFSHNLPKKVRQLALKTAFSSKLASHDLIIINEAALSSHKTKDLAAKLAKLGASKAVFIVDSIEGNFEKATRNLPFVKVLPTGGANVYDVMRAPKLVLTAAAVELLVARLNGEAAEAPKAAAKAEKPVKAKAEKAEKTTAAKAPKAKAAAKSKE